MTRAALLSVSDRTGLVEFAKGLKELGFVLLTTSGTTKFLNEHGVTVTPIEEYTGQREILDGRVKTLHPKIHGGLLAKRDNPTHLKQLDEEKIFPIEVAAINLYPFIQNLQGDAAKDPSKMIELIDIGGPTMIRAAAKNFKHVIPVIEPSDYPKVLESLKAGTPSLEFRRSLSAKVFTKIAHYNLEIARYLTTVSFDGDTSSVDRALEALSPTHGMVLSRVQELRYGENPHQKATLYKDLSAAPMSWEQLNGKELSYNNLLDFDAALKLIRSVKGDKPAACIIKHLNPCGVARGNTLIEALKKAKQGDPRSHFGGILAFSEEVDVQVAEDIRGDFAEVVLAPSYASDALKLLQGNKNLRVIKVPVVPTPATPKTEIRVIEGGVLVQEQDLRLSDIGEAKKVSEKAPSAKELADLAFAWKVCAHVKSNAIVIVKDETVIGVGTGQMSRIDSVELALSKLALHGHSAKGAVCASDAFFPFPDNVETLAKAGVASIVVTGGAKRDDEVIAAANKLGLSLLFTSDRHFRH